MNRWFIILCFSLVLSSCRPWRDKDLFIAEVFINARQEAFLLLKNAGNTRIDETGIDLTVYWDHDERILMQLDTMDPHFRRPGDSSIIRLPIVPGPGIHQVIARVDSKNQVLESDEDHNIYCRTLRSDSVNSNALTAYPLIKSAFDEKNFIKYFNQGRFAELAVWRLDGKAIPLVRWPASWKENLLQHIRQIYEGRPISYSDSVITSFAADTAQDIYLNYLAHSIYVEQERLVPWSIQDFAPEDLTELWDSKYFFYWDSLHQVYHLDYQSGGGIRIEHPLATYLFARGIQKEDHYTNSDEAILSMLSWSRAQMLHTENEHQIQFQSVPSTWYPVKGKVHTVSSCWAMGGLTLEYARALNLPVRRDQIQLYNGLHTSIIFPSLKLALGHADDIYDPLFYPVHQDMPVTTMLLTPDELRSVLTARHYCLQDTCHSEGSQHTYDRRRLLIKKAADYHSGYLWILHDAGKSMFKSYLRGDEFNTLLMPLFSNQEINTMEQLIKSYDQPTMILDRYRRYEASKNYRR